MRWPLLALGIFSLACSGTDEEPSKPERPALFTEVEARFDQAAADGFSGAALVTLDGERILAKGYGFLDRGQNVPNRETTAFDVGSILKSFTAAAIFVLDEEGVLDVSSALGDVIPEAPADKAAITLLQIVQHSAGFHEYHDTTGDFEPMTRLEARQRILEQPLLFPPGSDSAYSNSGYTLLADVVETVSGQTYVDFVRDRLFQPAGLDHTGFYSDELWQTVDTAIGYDADVFESNDPATWPYTWALVGNGGLVTTVVDLERWAKALFGGKILLPATFASFESEYLGDGAPLAGETAYAEAGAGDFGLGGVVIEVPARDTRVVIATNAYDSFEVEQFALEIANLLLDAE
jgi:CubicO group peptidase (beta-lactamase class C family)